MNEDLGRDLDVSHNVVNYLHSSYQGLFASLNMLSQLGYLNFNPDELSQCQENISFSERLLSQINQGIPVFSMVWKVAQTADAKETLSRITKLKAELLRAATVVENILIDPSQLQDVEKVKILIAAYARFAYTNEHYIKGFVDFGNAFTIPELVQSYEKLLPQAEQNITAAHLFFDIFTGDAPIPQIFYQSLFEEALFIPGMFRTNVHDLNKFLALYQQPLQFKHTDIPEKEAEEWRVINIDPNIAGYWHAFNFTANDLVDWAQVGISAPRQAWFWSCLMFSPETSRGWIQYGFAPPIARQWANNNFSPEEAIDHLKRGFSNPITAREEGRKIIDDTGES